MSILLPVGLYFTSVLGLHILLLTRWRTKDERFWKMTDYVWVISGVFGLVGLAERYDKQQRVAKIRDAELSLDSEYQSQDAWLGSLLSTRIADFIELKVSKADLDPNIPQKVPSPATSYFTLSSVQLLLQSNRAYIDHIDLLRNKLDDMSRQGRGGKESADVAKKMLDRAMPDEEALRVLKEQNRSYAALDVLEFLAPFLVAVALAVRTTRVSAEVHVLKKGTSAEQAAEQVASPPELPDANPLVQDDTKRPDPGESQK